MKQQEPVSEDVQRAVQRQKQQKAADEIKKKAVIKSELDKVKAGETKDKYAEYFGTDAGQSVLDDLKEFCFFEKPLYDDDQRQMFRNVVKNEVLHYILDKLKAKEEE